MRARPSETASAIPTQSPIGEFDPAEELERLWRVGQSPDLAAFVATLGPLSPDALSEVVRIDQHARWNRGERIPAEQYLADYPLLLDDPESSADVVYAELVLREERGEQPGLDEFAARFPGLADVLREQIGLHRALCETPGAESESIVTGSGGRGPLEVESEFSLYEIVREIGRGGSGVVYEARQTAVNRIVALKVLSAGPHAGSDQYLRFRAEAELIGRLQHPHIIQIFDAGIHAGCPFLALEFVAGGSLRERLTGAPQPPESCARLVEVLARAIHAAHLAGIVHRDLKPGNILFAGMTKSEMAPDARGAAWPTAAIPKIGDFGLAKSLHAGEEDSAPLTQTGDILGTPSYMSPEQAAGCSSVAPATDIYALGAILYELCTGRPPFQGVTALQTLQQVVAVDPVPPARLQPRLPRDLEVICLKCLEKQPGHRYATALDLADDLQRYLADRPILARPTPKWVQLGRWCRRNPVMATLAGLVIALLTALVVGSLAANFRLQEAANTRLVEARLAQARALVLSDRIGRRETSRSLLAEAAQVRPSPEIRNEAIAGMALFDLPIAGRGPEISPHHVGLDYDGSLAQYARADRDGQITVQRVADDAEICRIPRAIPNALLRMSPDGRYLAIRSVQSAEVQVWLTSASPGKLVLSESCNAVYGVGAIEFSRTGDLIAVGRPDGAVVVRSLPPGEFHREWKIDSPASHVAFHPQKPQIAISSITAVEVRDYRSGRLLARLDDSAGTNRVAWHPEGVWLATADRNPTISIWQPPNFTRVRTLPGHDAGGMELQFNASGTNLASWAWDGVVKFWDPCDGHLLFKSRTELAGLHCALDRDRWAGEVVAGRIQFWQADAREIYRRLHVASAPAVEWYQHLATAPRHVGSGRLLAVAMQDAVRFLDLATGRKLGELPLPGQARLTFEPSGALLTNSPKGIQRWPIAASIAVPGELMIGPPESVSPMGSNGDLASAGDGRTIAFGGTAGAFVIDADRPESLRRLAGHADPRYVSITRDGRWVATGSHNGTNVNVWDATTAKLVRELPFGRSRVAFSPDGQWLATASEGLSLWRVGDWKQVWQGAGQNLSAHAFTADGRFIAVETGLGTIVLYATLNGREIARLTDPYGRLQMWLVFSPDSRFLAGISHDSRGLTVWDLREVEDHLERMGVGAERVSSPETAGDASEDPLTISTPFKSDSESHAELDSRQNAPGDGPNLPGERK
jgi:serine/threonine protein kinase/WD40 repeat protein